MTTSQIAAQSFLRIPYDFPPIVGRIMVRVHASSPVHAYAVTEVGITAFLAGRPYTSYGGSGFGDEPPRRDYVFPVTMPPRAQWNLLITNPKQQMVSVAYDVTWAPQDT